MAQPHLQSACPPGGSGALRAARAALTAGQAGQALALVQPLLRAANDPAALDCAATCYWKLGDHETAMALMRVLTGSWPALADGWSKRAAMAASLGDRTLACDCLKRALALAPRSVPVMAALNRIAPFSRNGARTRRLRAAMRDRALAPADRALGHNALGRIEQAAGRIGPAFRHFAAAKALSAAPYDPAATDRRVARQLADYDPARLPLLPEFPGSRMGSPPRVVFVTGLPRSGTTLVETILSRHPQVESAGESRALTQARLGLTGERGEAWDWLERANPETGLAARAAYLDGLGPRLKSDTCLIVDKMPLNLFDLGFAAWILPRARFIFLDRHPLDVGLSCFTTNFHEGNGFSRDLASIGHLIRAVHRSARDYERHLGDRLRRQSYRALVHDSEGEIRAILAHVGLPFHPDCLSPEAAVGAVGTASLYQVREAIYQKGLGKWRSFATQLRPLEESLGREWLDAWEASDIAN